MKCVICSTLNAMREERKHPSLTSMQAATLKLKQLRSFHAEPEVMMKCGRDVAGHESELAEIGRLCVVDKVVKADRAIQKLVIDAAVRLGLVDAKAIY